MPFAHGWGLLQRNIQNIVECPPVSISGTRFGRSRTEVERQMTQNSDGEVFGAKALNLIVIGLSLLVLMGLFWQPAPAAW